MSLIPVLDVQAGQVVHAIAGRRADYRPLVSCWTPATDPLTVARALITAYRPPALYVADLDAITHITPTVGLLTALTDLPVPVWLDAGVRTAADVRRVLTSGANLCAVVGSETLDSASELFALTPAERGRVIFSVDLCAGQPLGTTTPAEVPADVAGMIVLDLARVGLGAGTGTEALLRTDRPHPRTYVGGGIASWAMLDELCAAGAAGCLVASALHAGRIPPRG